MDMHAFALALKQAEDAREPSRSLAVRLRDIFRSAIGAIVVHRRRKAAEAELMALDDRTLKDIGIDRSEISSAVLHRDRGRSGDILRAFVN